MDPAVSDISFSVESFHRALYGVASTDPQRKPEDIIMVRTGYMNALAQSENISAAVQEALKLAADCSSLDFNLWFLIEDIVTQSTGLNCPAAEDHCSQVVAAFAQKQSAVRANYDLILSHARNEYSGFSIPSAEWAPTVFPGLPAQEEILDFIARREPFVVSFGSLSDMSVALGWRLENWTSEEYLLERVHMFLVFPICHCKCNNRSLTFRSGLRKWCSSSPPLRGTTRIACCLGTVPLRDAVKYPSPRSC